MKRLLLADDSITIQKVVTLTFADEGIEVVTAGNGETAIGKIVETQPDLVLADIFMPGKNGYEVCEFVKSHPQLREIPVLLLVGTFEPFDETQAKKVQCDGKLVKPFETRALIKTVKALIARAEEGKSRTPAGEVGLLDVEAWLEGLARIDVEFVPENLILDLYEEETREAFALRGVSRTEWAGSFVEPLPAESPVAVATEPAVAVATEPAVAELPAIEMAPQGHGDPLVETVVQQVLSRLS
ncbi:MAG: response regulator, partial [Acidobacteria bacterium]|nr:response regulator [Acidobacteriota bacterium]